MKVDRKKEKEGSVLKRVHGDSRWWSQTTCESQHQHGASDMSGVKDFLF